MKLIWVKLDAENLVICLKLAIFRIVCRRDEVL